MRFAEVASARAPAAEASEVLGLVSLAHRRRPAAPGADSTTMQKFTSEEEEAVHAKYGASLISVYDAVERIRGQAHVTPVMTCSAIDRFSGMRCATFFEYHENNRDLVLFLLVDSAFFKCENFQKVKFCFLASPRKLTIDTEIGQHSCRSEHSSIVGSTTRSESMKLANRDVIKDSRFQNALLEYALL